jgi:AcrR family transcriptional regulator
VKTKSILVRQRVIRTAQKKILSSGARGWSMDELAADSGITKRTLYKIVPSKERLVGDIVIEFIRGVQKGIADLIAEGGDYPSVLERIVTRFPSFLDTMHSRTMRDIFLEYPAIENEVHARRAELTESLALYLGAGVDSGYLRDDVDPEFILQLFQAVVFYFVRFAEKSEDYSDKIGLALRCVLHGIVKGQKGTTVSKDS